MLFYACNPASERGRESARTVINARRAPPPHKTQNKNNNKQQLKESLGLGPSDFQVTSLDAQDTRLADLGEYAPALRRLEAKVAAFGKDAAGACGCCVVVAVVCACVFQ